MNPGILQNRRKTAKVQLKKQKMRNMWEVSVREQKKEKSGKSGRVADRGFVRNGFG